MIDFTDRETLIKILNEYGLRLQKKLGQHFLINRFDLEKIVEEGKLNKQDTVLEIGTGVGVLTQELCERAGKVIAYEIDEKTVKVVREKVLPRYGNLELIEGDFLKLKIEVECPFKVVANLPYQITTPVMRRFFEYGLLPEKIVVLIQKEVADKLAAKPGNADRGWLTVLIQAMGEVEIVYNVPRNSFLPPPEVESAVLIVRNTHELDIDKKAFLRCVRAGFSSKRRKLANSLAGGLGIDLDLARGSIEKAGIDENLRAEDLETEDWKKLTGTFN